MRKRKPTDITVYYPLAKRTLYLKVAIWVFLCFLLLELMILLAAYTIFYNPKINLRHQSELLFVYGCVISTLFSVGLLLVLRLILRIYDHSGAIRNEEEYNMLADLNNAVKNGEMRLYFQPQVDLKSGKIIGMEALLRWHHPIKGVIMPSDFITLAERAELIQELGEWTLMQACMYNKVLLDKGHNLRVAVNLSPIQFNDKYIVDDIEEILAATGLPAHNLELEITETSMIQNIELAMQTMGQLRITGVILVMDDFGTGYSSLAHIDRFPIQKIKIDKAFVHSISAYDEMPNIADSIIEMAHKLNLSILVEGIETEYQKKYFTELKCQEGQGYFLGAPVPAEKFERYL